MLPASFYFSASPVRRRQCQKLIVPSSSSPPPPPPPQQPGSSSKAAHACRASTCSSAAYRGLCMRATPKRTRVQTVCKRAADVQHLLESAPRPPSSTLPSLAQAACTRYAPSTSLSPDQLGTQPQTGNLLTNPCTTGHDGSMACFLDTYSNNAAASPASIQPSIDRNNTVTGTAPSPMLST